MPTISVIVPAYNAEKTILETITSVLNQTFSDFELIVINDGSTDKTLERLNTLEDSRLKIFSYENGGESVARNRGISQATGDFIAFIDADDLWTPDKLELQLAALQQHPEAGVAYSWAYYMDEDGESLQAEPPIFVQGNVQVELLVKDFIVSGSNCMVRREAIKSVGEFDPSLPCAADWDYWLRLAARWPFVVVPKHQILYRISSNSASSQVEVMERCNLIVIERGFLSVPPEIKSLKNQSLANTYRFSAHLYLMRVGTTDAAQKTIHKLRMAIRLYPPILRESWTRNLLIKALLIRLISPKISHSLLQWITKLRTTRNPSLQQSQP